jgi:N-acyl homoserine lactone hydrolase
LIDRLYQPTRRDIVAALAQNNGIEPRDIDAIVITHLHFDHVGGAQFFAGTPIYVQRAEWEAAQAPKYTIPEWLDFPAANWRLLDGDAELAPGLRVISTPGHTPGHQAVAVSVPAGTVLLAGQALETLKDWEAMLGADAPDETARKLHDLDAVAVLFSHDHAQWWRELP